MATENLQIPDILSNQNSKEVTANAAHNLLDRAMNNNIPLAMSAGINNLTTTQARENFVIELTGTPGSAFTLEMPDTNKRTLAIVNNSDDVCTVQNPSAGGTGQPVIIVGEASIFHFDGTDFFDLSALALAATAWLGLSDTPSAYTGESGRHPQVNDAENALEFVGTAAKRNVIAATTVNSALASTFENGDVIDTVTLATGDRILIKNQSNGEENGIYRVEATGAPTRVADFDDALDMQESPVMVPVLEGSANVGTVWIHTTAGAIVVDTTPLTFVQLVTPATFISLTDVPGSFTGESGTRVAVNNAEIALVFEGTPVKDPVVVATTASLTLSTDVENGDTIDGVTLVTGDRVLIKDQGSSEDGIYIVEGSGAPTRSDDLDDDKDAVLGLTVVINEGTVNKQRWYQMTNITAVTIGATTMVFAQVGGGAAQRFTEATVQTTDDTVTNIATIAVASGESVMVRGFGVGQGPSVATTSFEFIGSAFNNAGTTTLNGQIVRTMDDQTNNYAITIDADDAGDTLRIRVTGIVATTIDWRIEYETITEA